MDCELRYFTRQPEEGGGGVQVLMAHGYLKPAKQNKCCPSFIKHGSPSISYEGKGTSLLILIDFIERFLFQA